MSEWETDSDPPTDSEDKDTNKENMDNAANEGKPKLDESQEKNTSQEGEKTDSAPKSDDKSTEETKKTQGDADHSQDDVLKLDATAEMDEFSKFLNEFEDTVLAEKKKDGEEEEKVITKRPRIETERKIVNGKRLRKKVKTREPNGGVEDAVGEGCRAGAARTPSLSPEGGDTYNTRHWPRRRTPPPSRRSSADWRTGSNRVSPYSKRGERGLRPTHDDSPLLIGKEADRREAKQNDSATAAAEKERQEYEERLSKLSTPEREKLEMRRKKFESKKEIKTTQPKKISLRTESNEQQTVLPLPGQRREQRRLSSEEGVSLDISDTLDMFDEPEEQAMVDRRKRSLDLVGRSPPKKKQFTDLRVQLHKKKQAKLAEDPKAGQLLPIRKSLQDVEQENNRLQKEEVEEEEEEPIPPFKGRIIVPPVKSKRSGSADTRLLAVSDESPSPPTKDRRVLVRKVSSNQDETDLNDTKPKQSTLKTSLHLRLGEKLDVDTYQFTEQEIWAEMIRQKEKKQKKKLKKEKKEKKKKKKGDKKIKSKTPTADNGKCSDDSADGNRTRENETDELFKFFEKEMSPVPEHAKSDRPQSRSSDDSLKLRWSSGDKSRHSSGGSGKGIDPILKEKFGSRLGDRLGEKVADSDNGGIASESNSHNKAKKLLTKKKKKKDEFDESVDGEDILKKMARRNKKREQRNKEIERDKLMFA